jgi:hypothetical protein
VLAARAEAIEAIYAEGTAGEELSEICGSHVDYMWDIIVTPPPNQGVSYTNSRYPTTVPIVSAASTVT